MYLVRFSIIKLVVVTVVKAGPVHTVFTVTGTFTAELNSTVQVRLGEDPAIIASTGGVTTTKVGAGTEGIFTLFIYNYRVSTLCGREITHGALK